MFYFNTISHLFPIYNLLLSLVLSNYSRPLFFPPILILLFGLLSSTNGPKVLYIKSPLGTSSTSNSSDPYSFLVLSIALSFKALFYFLLILILV